MTRRTHWRQLGLSSRLRVAPAVSVLALTTTFARKLCDGLGVPGPLPRGSIVEDG
ncbi:MAG TPA: hypothetical protein VII53_00545 [Solirubrobacteraceae bacterium]